MTDGADPPSPLPPPEPPPHQEPAQLQAAHGLGATTTSAANGAQARDGAPAANARKRMGPTLDGWVVRKRERKYDDELIKPRLRASS